MKTFSLGRFIRISLFLIGILFLIVIVSLISYYSIDKVQKKNNLMDIEEFSPISSLVVESNKSFFVYNRNEIILVTIMRKITAGNILLILLK